MESIHKTKQLIPNVIFYLNVIFFLIGIFYINKVIFLIMVVLNMALAGTFWIIAKFGYLFDLLVVSNGFAKKLNVGLNNIQNG